MTLAEISRKLDVNEKALETLLRRVRERTDGSDDMATLQAAVVVQSRPGRNKRAEPGSDLALAVREAVRKNPQKKFVDAANDEIRRLQDLGELDADVKPLGNQTVYHILQDPKHCKADPRGQKRIVLKRQHNEKTDKKGGEDLDNSGIEQLPLPDNDFTILENVQQST
ncbi:hypothetical protein Q7P37_001014 [Cladosporium fusiforme]